MIFAGELSNANLQNALRPLGVAAVESDTQFTQALPVGIEIGIVTVPAGDFDDVLHGRGQSFEMTVLDRLARGFLYHQGMTAELIV